MTLIPCDGNPTYIIILISEDREKIELSTHFFWRLKNEPVEQELRSELFNLSELDFFLHLFCKPPIRNSVDFPREPICCHLA